MSRIQRVFLSADLEGIAGVVASEELRSGNAEYETARQLMTEKVNAAIRGVCAAGVETVVVADSHGRYRNLLIEQLDPRSRLVRGRPRTLAMVEGVRNADAMALIGYHGRAHTTGVLCHTFNDVVRDIRCNTQSVGEAWLSAAVASHLGTPLLLATGDDALAHEVASFAPKVATVSVKQAGLAFAANSVHPTLALQQIEKAARAAVDQDAVGYVEAGAPIRGRARHPRSSRQGRHRSRPRTLRRQDPPGVEADDIVTAYRWVRVIIELADQAP